MSNGNAMFTEENRVLMVFGVVWIVGVVTCRKFYAARGVLDALQLIRREH